MTKFLCRLLFAMAFMVLASTAPLSAQFVAPHGVCGAQPQLTFGGSGIPNNEVMSNINEGTLGISLGLAATARYSDPVVTNDGACTYYATPGTDLNFPSPADPYAMWNIDFAIDGVNAANYNYKLFYDFNPAVGNTDWGNLTIAPIPTQNSWNLGMNFLSPPSALPGIIYPPVYGPFDPNASGQYSAFLVAYDNMFNVVDYVGINVDVGTPQSVVPEPMTMSMMAMGLVGIGGAGIKRRKRTTA